MATQDNSQTSNRNDPAIDPDTPDNNMGQKQAPTENQGGAQSQDQNGAQSQANNGNLSGENSFTPDFEPDEQKSPNETAQVNQTGAKAPDIDTPGG
jgi:hypothetical protein